MTVLDTDRLRVRLIRLEDADFILELLNDSAFVRFVGDKNVRTVEAAREYILSGPLTSYSQNGFGLWLVETKMTGIAVGLCGLLKRETLADVDIGFAFLPPYRSLGYAFESASAVFQYAREVLGIRRIVAIANPDNTRSIRVLEKIGMTFERTVRLSADGREVQLLVSDA